MLSVLFNLQNGIAQEIIFSDNFDAGPRPGWKTGATGVNGGSDGRSSWQCGAPHGGYGFRYANGAFYIVGNPDPVYDHSEGDGNGVYGQGLNPTQYVEGVSSHFSNSNEYLISPKINCRMYISITLSFWRWANFQRNVDKPFLEISTDSIHWKALSHPTQVQDAEWTYYSVNISSYANRKPSVFIRWRSVSDSSQHYSGWNIDDVTITGINISTLEWTGAYSDEWGNGANWNYPAIPDTSTDVIIHPAAFNPVITSARKCKNITINPGAGLFIDSAGSLTVAKNLHIVNNSSGKGMIINKGALNITGNTMVDAWFNSNIWTFYSCPVANIPITYFNADRNMVYHEPYGADDWNKAWLRAVNNFVPGKGYDIRYSSDTTVTIITKNALNKGTYSVIINNTEGAETDDHKGWNLVGNPYPSYIDWDAILLSSTVNNATYIYDGTTKTYLTYINGIGINGGSRFIEPSTAFFIKVNTTGKDTLYFTDQMRTLTTETGQGLKSTGNGGKTLRLKITGNGYSDETALRFITGATSAPDPQLDAIKMFITENAVPQIYTTDAAGNNYAINSMPDIQGYLNVALSIKTGITSAYTLEVTQFEFNPDETVMLEDTKTGQSMVLSDFSTYSFDAPATDPSSRFILHFGLNLVTSAGNHMPTAAAPIIFNHNQTLTINLGCNSEAQAKIFDITGHCIKTIDIRSSHTTHRLDLLPGCYIVRVTSEGKTTGKKIIIE